MVGQCNITYSGGQATEGQGGFYGSGGSRATLTPPSLHRPEMLALETDVQQIAHTMRELDLLEDMLTADQRANEGRVTGKSVELRGKIKHLVTGREFMECLGRLEIKGEPVWGLSGEERDLVKHARYKVTQC
eukprot:CAMPEP_0183308892 /NCGR_PEP_ID=MMETSP0160_2-20130417/22876_1 /TAXON_ID=2839 ORGANISM="Odontella Sinensis, Strain Grunow 1884" /NCGR_SAMPLE_ID=MMETSP0160_2 /ASSEMBLY_ACC=CAM_ASM_000250 /LENGTH=131 /DNA_ID=CAMNT_0025472807 /DNA_START=177 /DNA_END=572 /DNA_ORIENTATION=-